MQITLQKVSSCHATKLGTASPGFDCHLCVGVTATRLCVGRCVIVPLVNTYLFAGSTCMLSLLCVGLPPHVWLSVAVAAPESTQLL